MGLTKTITYGKLIADNCLPVAESVIQKKCPHVSGSYKYDGSKINCSVYASTVLQKAGILPATITLSHTAASHSKATLKDCASNTDKVKHVVWKKAGKKYNDLNANMRVPGCIYIYASTIAIKGHDGIYGCHSTGKTYNSLSMIRQGKSTYEYTHKILWVGIPDIEVFPTVKTYRVSEACIKLVKEFEGCRLKSYQDEVGVWTIGYGITSADKSITGKTIRSGMTISQKQADDWLEKCLNELYLPKVMKYAAKYNFTHAQIDALVSFAYNIGSIDQLTDNGKRTLSVIRAKMMLYNKAGGKVYRGLTRRRETEVKMFDGPLMAYDGPIPTLPKRGYFMNDDESGEVKKVQYILAYYGLYSGTIDPKYGPKCIAGTKALQQIAGLPVNGKFGKKCLEFIKGYSI